MSLHTNLVRRFVRSGKVAGSVVRGESHDGCPRGVDLDDQARCSQQGGQAVGPGPRNDQARPGSAIRHALEEISVRRDPAARRLVGESSARHEQAQRCRLYFAHRLKPRQRQPHPIAPVGIQVVHDQERRPTKEWRCGDHVEQPCGTPIVVADPQHPPLRSVIGSDEIDVHREHTITGALRELHRTHEPLGLGTRAIDDCSGVGVGRQQEKHGRDRRAPRADSTRATLLHVVALAARPWHVVRRMARTRPGRYHGGDRSHGLEFPGSAHQQRETTQKRLPIGHAVAHPIVRSRSAKSNRFRNAIIDGPDRRGRPGTARRRRLGLLVDPARPDLSCRRLEPM
jgi:hypothetical protein